MRLSTVKILGILITSTSASSVLRELTAFVAKPASLNTSLGGPASLPPLVVFTPNPEFLVEAAKDSEFRELLNRADINLPDGIGILWASRILGTPIKERVSGADVVEKLLEIGNEQRWIIGVAGARRGDQKEAEELVRRLQLKYPCLKFVNLDDSQFKIYNLQFKIIFACHGMKKQEQWILANKNKINANVFMGIGGSLDFIVGFTKRAPLRMRQVGLEWLWRGLQRPGHWKRIWKAVFTFGWMVMKEKLNIFLRLYPQ